MLRDKLTSYLAGCILNAIKETGAKSHLCDESRINRKYMQREHFKKLRFYILVRVLYNLALLSDQKTFEQLGSRIFADIWQYAETHGYDFNDEKF